MPVYYDESPVSDHGESHVSKTAGKTLTVSRKTLVQSGMSDSS